MSLVELIPAEIMLGASYVGISVLVGLNERNMGTSHA